MTVKRKGPMPGFRAAKQSSRAPKVRKPVTEAVGSGMTTARQAAPENMHSWTGVRVYSLADIPAGCICDWIAYKGGLEIKFFNGLCSIRHTGRGE